MESCSWKRKDVVKIACRTTTVPLGFFLEDEGTWQWPERNDFSASDLWQGELLSSEYISPHHHPPRVLFSASRPPHRPFIPSAGLAREIADRNLSNFPNGSFLVEEIERSIKRGTRTILFEREWKLGWSFVRGRGYYIIRVVRSSIRFSSSRRKFYRFDGMDFQL